MNRSRFDNTAPPQDNHPEVTPTPTEIAMTERLSTILRRKIRESEKSYRELAEATGLDHTALNQFTLGKRGMNLDTIERLVAYFGLDIVEKNGVPAPKKAKKKSRKSD